MKHLTIKFPQVDGYLILEDVLDGRRVGAQGMFVDAVVNVTLVQSGVDKLSVEEIEIDGEMLDIEDPTDGSISYILTHNVAPDFMDDLYEKIETIAIEIAKNTQEDKWEYRTE